MEDPCVCLLNVCQWGCILLVVLKRAVLGLCRMNSALPFPSPGYIKWLVFALALGTKEKVVTNSFMPPCSWDDSSHAVVHSSGWSRYSNRCLGEQLLSPWLWGEAARSVIRCWNLETFPGSQGLSAEWSPSSGCCAWMSPFGDQETGYIVGVSAGLLEAAWLSADTAGTQDWVLLLSTFIIKPLVWEGAAECFALRLTNFSQILLCTPDSVKTWGNHCPLGEAELDALVLLPAGAAAEEERGVAWSGGLLEPLLCVWWSPCCHVGSHLPGLEHMMKFFLSSCWQQCGCFPPHEAGRCPALPQLTDGTSQGHSWKMRSAKPAPQKVLQSALSHGLVRGANDGQLWSLQIK